MRAAGYLPARLPLPKIEEAAGSSLRVALRPAAEVTRQPLVSARLMDGDDPVADTRVTLSVLPRREMNAMNACIHRGVIVPTRTIGLGEAATDDEGHFRIEMPSEMPERVREAPLLLRVYVGPGTPTLVGPLHAEEGVLSGRIPLPHRGGRLLGRVTGFPPSAAGRCHAVLFNRTGLLAERTLWSEATFEFARLPFGEYGVRIGTGRYEDRTNPVLAFAEPQPDPFTVEAEPWKGVDPIVLGVDEVARVEVPYPDPS